MYRTYEQVGLFLNFLSPTHLTMQPRKVELSSKINPPKEFSVVIAQLHVR